MRVPCTSLPAMQRAKLLAKAVPSTRSILRDIAEQCRLAPRSTVFLGLFVSLMGSAAATSQCLSEAKCEPLPDEFLVSVAASIAGAKNVCSRIDPSRGSEYAEAANRLVGEDREAFIKAQQSALFPKALEAVEVELGATPAEKLARRCAAFLKKK